MLIFLISTANAQIDLDKIKEWVKIIQPKSNEYVMVNDNILNLKPYFHFPEMSLRLKNDGGEVFKYRPNVKDNIGLEVNLKGISMSTSLQLPVRASDVTRYGPTQFTNFQTNITTRSAGLAVEYLKFKGFYSPNKLLFIPDDRYIRGDLQVLLFGISTYFLPSGKVSIAASITQSEKQLKSAGSFTIGLSEIILNIKSDSSFIVQEKLNYFPYLKNISKGFYNAIAVKPGYSYTYIYKDYFVTGLFCMGPSLTLASNKLYSKIKRDYYIKPSVSTTFKFIIGIHKERIFGNILWEIENNSFPIKNEKIISLNQSLKIGVGLKI